MNKITQLHVYLIGFVVMGLLGGGLWYTLLKPVNEEIEQLKQNVAQQEGTSVQVDGQSFTIASAGAEQAQAKAALEGARVRRAGKQRQLASLENRKRLPRSQEINIGDGAEPTLLARTMPRWLQLPRVLVETMENYAQKLAKKHRVTVNTQFTVPPPSTRPGDIPKDIIARNLGSMTITGPFDNVMRWSQDWNSAPLLVSVDGLKMALAGNGKVQASSTLTVYLFPTGQAVQTASGSGAAAAPGAAPGMAPGMAPTGMTPGAPGAPGAPAMNGP